MPAEQRPLWRIGIITILSLAAAWQLFVAVFMSPGWIGAACTVDDTYLALEVGRRWPESGFPTFDGLHRTSGFQPLWGLVLYALAHISTAPETLLRLTLIVAAVCNTLAGVLLSRLAYRISCNDWRLAFAAVAFWSAYCVSCQPALIGLENALLPAELAGSLLLLFKLRSDPTSVGRWCAMAFLCIAMVWTRLDAAMFVLALLAIAIRAAGRRAICRGSLMASLILSAGAISYGLFENWAGGQLTPISGSVKRSIAATLPDTNGPTSAQARLALFDAGNELLKHAMIGIGCGTPRALSSAGRFAWIGLLVLLTLRRPPRTDWLIYASGVAFLHAFLIRVWLGRYFHDTAWYYSAENLLAALGLPLLIMGVAPSTARPIQIAAASAVIFTMRLTYVGWLISQPAPAEHVSVVRRQAAEWLHAHVPPNERIAAWNAGQIAYFSERTVINLDGLMNDGEFLRRFVRGGEPLSRYLDEQNVNWVIDYAEGSDSNPDSYWATLPRSNWTPMQKFGADEKTAQLIVRRR